MINLLVQLHIMFPLRSPNQKQRKYFVPCLLKENEPQHNHGIESEFGFRIGGQHRVVLDRTFKMKNQASVPVAVMPMVIVQLMKIGEVIECWQQGCAVAIYPADGLSKAVECCCLVKRKRGDKLNIKLEGVSSEVAGWWMKEVMRSLENMLEEFYHMDYDVEVASYGEGGGMSCFPCQYKFSYLYKILAQRKVTALCQNKSHNVALQYLVPDLLIQEASTLSLVSWEDLEIEKELGQGSFGKVLLCSSSINFQKLSSGGERKLSSSSTPSLASSPPISSPPPLSFPKLPSSISPPIPSLLSVPSLCEYCERREVKFFCNQCEKDESFLCQNCRQTLHLGKRKRNHTPVPILEYLKENATESISPSPSLSPSPSPSPSSSSPSSHLPPPLPSLSSPSLSSVIEREERESTHFAYAAKVLEPKHVKLAQDSCQIVSDEKKPPTEEGLQKDFLLEVYTMTGLVHPNIVRLVGITHPLSSSLNEFHHNHAMVMELVGGGDLYGQINFMGLNLLVLVDSVIKSVGSYRSQLNLHFVKPSVFPAPAPLPPLLHLCNGAFKKLNQYFDKWLGIAGRSHGEQINALRDSLKIGIERGYEGNFEGSEEEKRVFENLKETSKKVEDLIRETTEIYAPLPWVLRLKIAFDIALGIHYLHSLNPPIIHHDLKTPNVFLTRSLIQFPITEQTLREPLAKVGDFGWSVKLVGASSLVGGKNSKTECVTATWAAPEVLKGQEFTEKIDIHAIGIMLWEILVRRYPYSFDLEVELMEVLKGFIHKKGRPSIPRSVLEHENENNPELLKKYLDLMNSCWDHQPSHRPTALQVCESLFEMIQGESPLFHKVLNQVGVLDQLRKEIDVTADAHHPSRHSHHSLSVATLRLSEMMSVKEKWKVKRVLFAGLDWLWIGFWNGYVGVIEVKKAIGGNPKLILCNEKDTHKKEVRAMVYQSFGGHVWTSSMCGTLRVWKDAPLNCEDAIEHFNIKGWLRKVSLWSEDMWVSLDTGRLRIFKHQYFGTEEDSILINKNTVVTSFLSTPKPAIQVQCPEQDKTFKFAVAKAEENMRGSPSLSQWLSALEQFSRMLLFDLSLLCLGVKQPENSSIDEDGGDEAGSKGFGFLGLEAVGHSVWGFTNAFQVVEFTLIMVEDEHGLHRTSRIETKRVLQLDQVAIEGRFQNTARSGMVSIGKSTLCLAVGNAVGMIQIQDGSDKMMGGVGWCQEKDRGSSYIRCLTSVWNGNWVVGNRGGIREKQEEEKEEEDFPLPLPSQTVKKGPELWAYDGEKILIFRSIDSGDHQQLILVDQVGVPSDDFLSCLVQVGPNEIWGGTAATGNVIGWEIETRSPLSHPLLSKEDVHDGNVSSLAVPSRAIGVNQKMSVVFSSSTDGTLRLFCYKNFG